KDAVALTIILDSGHSLTHALRWEILQLNYIEQQILRFGTLLLCAIALLMTLCYRPVILLGNVTLSVVVFYGLYFLFNPVVLNIKIGLMQELMIWAIPLGLIF